MSANGGEPLVEVRDLVKHFPLTKGILFNRRVGEVRAVDGVSFDVMRGETLGLVGESGCGKSTTARLLLRLIDPTSGSVKIDGREIANIKGAELKAVRREMQMIFQDPYSSLNPRKTVGTIIGDPFAIHGLEQGRGRAQEGRPGADGPRRASTRSTTTATRTSSRAASGSASAWRARSRSGRS